MYPLHISDTACPTITLPPAKETERSTSLTRVYALSLAQQAELQTRTSSPESTCVLTYRDRKRLMLFHTMTQQKRVETNVVLKGMLIYIAVKTMFHHATKNMLPKDSELPTWPRYTALPKK